MFLYRAWNVGCSWIEGMYFSELAKKVAVEDLLYDTFEGYFHNWNSIHFWVQVGLGHVSTGSPVVWGTSTTHSRYMYLHISLSIHKFNISFRLVLVLLHPIVSSRLYKR
jgi:hypothetical protein